MDAREHARKLEKEGKFDAAVRAFREAGAVEDAARVLAGQLKKPAEAARLLLESLKGPVAQQQGGGRKRALMAGIYFARAGDKDQALPIFLALGEQQRAVELLQRLGDTLGAARLAALKRGEFETGPMLAPARAAQAVGGQAVSLQAAQRLEQVGRHDLALDAYAQLRRFGDAARMAVKLGRTQDAAQLYADAGMPFEAAEAYLALGDTGRALDNLCRVPREDPRSRQAAAQAVHIASELNVLDFRLDHMMSAFVAAGPQDAGELKAFDLLATLYLRHELPGNAKEVVEKILARDPQFPAARGKLQRAEELLRPTAAVARSVLSDADLHRRNTLVEKKPSATLPELGDLPGFDDEPATMMRHDPALVARVTGNDVIGEAEVLVESEEPLPLGFAVGATVAGRYKLEAQIGQGGMASVYRAHDLELDEKVALKVFGAQRVTEVLLQRFKQELKLSRQLQHPNIIRLYDIGLHEGHRYLSMELLLGESLKERMARGLGLREGLGFLVQACRGLQAAHEAGVTHRDVKPDNFFVTRDGVLKVMDFGIAKQHAAPGVTVAGSIAGTPLYMSPEQIGNFSAVTHLTDLYALGVCAYELLSGAPPFQHDELVPLLMMHVNTAPKPLTGVPPELGALVLQLLEKDPARRVQSCRELGEKLAAIRDKLT